MEKKSRYFDYFALNTLTIFVLLVSVFLFAGTLTAQIAGIGFIGWLIGKFDGEMTMTQVIATRREENKPL